MRINIDNRITTILQPCYNRITTVLPSYFCRISIVLLLFFYCITLLYAQQLDLNTATIQELMSVEGITEEIAKNIIAYREARPFKIVDDLKKVEGVSDELYLSVRDKFFVSAIDELEEVEFDTAEEAERLAETTEIEDEKKEEITIEENILEELRRSPLDLNTASKTDFLDLPGVTYQIAEAIVAYRKRTPFKSLEELKDVKGITPEILAEIRPFVRVMRVDEREVFAGDTVFRIGPHKYPADPDPYDDPDKFNLTTLVEPFDNPLALYNKTRLRFGSSYEAGFLIKSESWEPSISFQTLRDFHFRKFYVKANNVFGLDKIIAGDYRLQYAQGLVFNYLGGMFGGIKVKPKGLREDLNSNPNIHFRGVAFEKEILNFNFAGFYSYKGLYSNLNPDGTARFDLETDAKEYADDLNMIYSEKDPYRNINRKDKLYEELLGGRVQWRFAPGTHISFTGYNAYYTPPICQKSWDGSNYVLWDIYRFRGDKNTVIGVDFETWLKGINFLGEYAKSFEGGKDKLNLPSPYNKERSGDAWLMQAIYHLKKWTFWVAYWEYDPDYYNPHSSALSVTSDKDFNQRGSYIGTNYKDRKIESEISYMPVKRIVPSAIDDALSYSRMRRGTISYPDSKDTFRFDIKYKPLRELELRYRYLDIRYDDYREVNPDVGKTDVLIGEIRNRYQMITKPLKAISLKVGFDDFSRVIPQYNYKEFGWLSFCELKYNLTSDMKVSLMYKIYDTFDYDTKIYSIGEAWSRIWTSAQYTEKGREWYLTISQKLDRNTTLWLKYENDFKVEDNYTKHAFRVQFDHKWGAMPKKARARRLERDDEQPTPILKPRDE